MEKHPGLGKLGGKGEKSTPLRPLWLAMWDKQQEGEGISQIGNYRKFWHWEGHQGLEKGSESMEMGKKNADVTPGDRAGWLWEG